MNIQLGTLTIAMGTLILTTDISKNCGLELITWDSCSNIWNQWQFVVVDTNSDMGHYNHNSRDW